MTRAARGIAGAAGLIAIITVLARITGFGRTLVFADGVRAAGIGEIYTAVNAVPNVLYEVAAGGALAAVAVPLVAGHLGAGRVDAAHRVGSALLTWALVVLVPAAVLVWLLADPIAGWLVGPKVPGGQSDGAAMLRVFAWQIPLYGIGVVLAGILQAHRRFLAPALAPLLSSLVVVGAYATYGSIVDGATTGVGARALSVLAWGTTAGVAALSLPLVLPALRTGWRYRATLRFPAGEARRARGLALAGVLALAAQQGAILVVIWLASNRGGGEGTLSVQNWIQAVYLLPYAVLAVPLATAAFPSLAAGHDTDPGRTATTLSRTLRAVILLTGVGVAALIAAAPHVGRFFELLDARRGGGRVSGSAVDALGAGLQAYAPGLIGFAVAAVLTRALYVRGRPMAAGSAVAVGWAISAVGPLLSLPSESSPHRILVGLGIWSSVGMTVAAISLGVLVRRAWPREGLAHVMGTAVVTISATVTGALLALALTSRASGEHGMIGTVLTGVGAAVLGAGLSVAVIGIAHRDSVRLLDPRRVRGGGR